MGLVKRWSNTYFSTAEIKIIQKKTDKNPIEVHWYIDLGGGVVFLLGLESQVKSP